MTLRDLIFLTRQYCRDNNSYMFTDAQIELFLNQAIDRIKQYNVFLGMKKLSDYDDVPNILPDEYHYMLALFSSSRCFDMDERFYEGTEKRNEFESILGQLISDIESGNIQLYDTDGEGNLVPIENGYTCIDYIKDVYFKPEIKDEEVIPT